ncbi:MAG: hypothetical protein IPK27_12505 [Rhodanobacteraceae bacterium]|nr:hypothetical protein [Rhodanobacteraceae bacterium]
MRESASSPPMVAPATRASTRAGTVTSRSGLLANGFVTALREPQPGDFGVLHATGGMPACTKEVLSDGDVDPSGLIPSLIDALVSRLRFDFTPRAPAPQARAVAPDLTRSVAKSVFAPRADPGFRNPAQT